MSGYYNVTLVHDYFTIQTNVTADSVEEAVKTAKQFFTSDQGLPDWVSDGYHSTVVELEEGI